MRKLIGTIWKSNGYLITFPLMWLLLGFRDASKGDLGQALLDVSLALVMLVIPPMVDYVRNDSQKEFADLAQAVDNLKMAIWHDIEPMLIRMVNILIAILDRFSKWLDRFQ